MGQCLTLAQFFYNAGGSFFLVKIMQKMHLFGKSRANPESSVRIYALISPLPQHIQGVIRDFRIC